GRAFWEYDQDRINGYGTPMAPMLLPYWTDGCIGSQEGLYFESSTTVPYHFLMQSELSAEPSQPQRELPYPGFDLETGVRHLQLLGVKYYLAVTPQAVGAAAAHPDLTEVAVSGPWHVYQVAETDLVTPMAYEPVVVRGLGEGQHEWLPTASAWFLDPDQLDVPLAAEGPESWARIDLDAVPEDERDVVRYAREQLGLTGPMDQVADAPRTELPAVEVTNISQTTDQISFEVSEPGVPVLVRASYFPNWEVEGAEGPYRVTPNLMVVVPTGERVTLTYGRTPVDLLGAGLTLLGLVGLVVLARRPPVQVAPYAPGRVSAWLDRAVTIRPKPDREPRGEAPVVLTDQGPPADDHGVHDHGVDDQGTDEGPPTGPVADVAPPRPDGPAEPPQAGTP
nr:hypothetical protein [Aquihabitans sp.]